MKRFFSKSFVVAAALSFGIAVSAYAGLVRTFAVQYINSPQSTALEPAAGGGQPIYQNNTVTVPADTNELEITISGTGDLADAENSLWLNCQVDGTDCVSAGTNSAANSVSGWVPVLSLTQAAQIAAASTSPATATDNNVHYTWCVQIKPKKGANPLTHKVQLSMASGNGSTVEIEQLLVSVGGAKVWDAGNACTAATPPATVH